MIKRLGGVAAAWMLVLAVNAAAAQGVQTIDPNTADAYTPVRQNEVASPESTYDPYEQTEHVVTDQSAPAAAPVPTSPPPVQSGMAREDVFTAAEGVFGRGAEGLAKLIEDILRDQGQPIAYIAGQEAGGALVLGVRYGSGIMTHQIEGEREVYWTGPSLGFDFGANANKVFVLVYNLHDAQELFRRYPGAEGNAYAIGGFTAQYLRRGDVVLIPIRLGVGLRLGVNAGYMRFTENTRWLPF